MIMAAWLSDRTNKWTKFHVFPSIDSAMGSRDIEVLARTSATLCGVTPKAAYAIESRLPGGLDIRVVCSKCANAAITNAAEGVAL